MFVILKKGTDPISWEVIALLAQNCFGFHSSQKNLPHFPHMPQSPVDVYTLIKSNYNNKREKQQYGKNNRSGKKFSFNAGKCIIKDIGHKCSKRWKCPVSVLKP